MRLTEKKPAVLVKTVIITLAVLAVCYLGASLYFCSHFLPSSELNGIEVSGISKERAQERITQEIDSYALCIETRGGKQETLRGEAISLKPEFGDSIEKQIRKQNGFAWIFALFTPQKIHTPTVVTFDEEKLKEQVQTLDFMQKKQQKEPEDAYISDYTPEGYQIIAEEKGSKIKKKRLFSVVKEAISDLKDTISLEEENCYAKPQVTREDTSLRTLADALNRYALVTVTYRLGDRKEVLDGGTIHTWLTVEGDQVALDEAAVEAYVNDLASSHNTAFRKHTLETSYGKTVDITTGDYGWKVDKEGEKEQLLEDLRAGEAVEREIVYAQTAASHGENDYGDTYVEINLTAQHLFFYKDGELIVESDFVSGNISRNYDTPTGIYGLTYKERDAVLRGENYASPVDYWMPFCNNVGMHDASWRRSFGGGIYKTSGSHGCINLPAAAAQTIFEQIEKGDPVIVYTLPGTESAAAVAQEAAQVVSMINSIGEVTLESETIILTARKLYNMLPPSGQAKVSNYDLLLASEAQLAALKAAAAAPAEGEPPAQPQEG